MSSSCQDLVRLLKECIMRSDCVVKEGRLPSDCLRNHFSELSEECQSVRIAVFNCKRGMLDMRKRMRGNNPGWVHPPTAAGESTAIPSSAS